MNDEKEFSWQVEGTLPTKAADGRQYRRPVWFQVAAPSMEEALDKVLSHYNDVVFIKCIKDRHVEAVITRRKDES